MNDTPAPSLASTHQRHPASADPSAAVQLGRSGLSITRLGFGCASIGGLYRPVTDSDAVAVARHAWDLGIRYFDVAPLYGYGAGERRLGQAVADRARDDYVVSTKVGRLVRPSHEIPPGAELDPQALGERHNAYYADVGDRRIVFDYSADGVRRSLAASLERLCLDRVDILLIHDPDEHWEQAVTDAYPALDRLRNEGVVRAIGVGMNQSPLLARFARETDVDLVLVAGRYSLLDQGALDDLLPTCQARGVAVLVAGVMNSGVLAAPRPGAAYDYRPAPGDMIEKARRMEQICERHEVPVRAAAIQFPLAHPAVAGLVTGVRTVEHLDEYPRFLGLPIPGSLWAELRSEGLLREDAPTP